MAVASNFPAIRPSLNLDFANARALDPRITFSRASAATYYDGKTVAKAEENLLTYSQEFSTTVWAITAVSRVANSAAAPDGTVTADTLTADATNDRHSIVQISASLAGTQRVFSCFVKANTHNFVQLLFGTDVQAFANFNVTAGAGAVGTVGSTASASIVDAGNGWYRCIISTSSATANTLVYISLTSSESAARYETWNTVGTESVYLWGAQLEQRSQVTAYTPTTSQPITDYIPVLQTAPAGVPRFDHNPVTGESLGLLVEEQRTNLLTYSEFQTGVSGTTQGGLITTSEILGALSENSKAAQFGYDGINPSYLYKGITQASTQYTLSVFVKMDDGLPPTFGNSTASSAANDFALAIGNAGVNPLTYTVKHVGNGVYRVSGTSTTGTVGLGNNGVVKYSTNSARTFKTTGWQLEAGAFPTSYIKTEASQVTRAADSAQMTGANFSSWYRQDEGTLFAEYFQNSSVSGGAGGVFSISNGTLSNRISLYADGASSVVIQPGIFVTAYGAAQVALIPSNGSANSFNKLIGRYKQNDFAASFNGVAVVTDTEGVLPSVDRAFIGQDATGVGQASINSTIKRLTYYPKRLTDAQLQALTA